MSVNTIRNPGKFRRILPFQQMREENWFDRRIYPQDVDGEVEKGFQFLWMEWREDGKGSSNAQRLAIVRRLWLMGRNGTQFVIFHADRDQEILPEDVCGLCVGGRGKWLQGQKSLVRFTTLMPVDWVGLGRWCSEWGLRAAGKPNSFMRMFHAAGPHVEFDRSYNPF